MLFLHALIFFVLGGSVMASPIVQRRDSTDEILKRMQGHWVGESRIKVSTALLISTDTNLILCP